jgi:hypothetical protein
MIKAASRDFYKEQNFNEAVENAHKCFVLENDAMRDPLKDILEDPKI